MQELNKYIQQAHHQGHTNEQIRHSLLAVGWNAEQVNNALAKAIHTGHHQDLNSNDSSSHKSQRVNRRTFIATFFVSAIPWIAVAGASNIANGFHGTVQNVLFAIFALLLLITILYWVVTSFMALIHRTHDIGLSTAVAVIAGCLTPFLLLLAIIPGNKAVNKYGSVPSKKFYLRPTLIWW